MQRHKFYRYWAVRLSARTLAITHVSRDPVLDTDHFRIESSFPGVSTDWILFVGSFHVVQREQQVGQQREGEQQGLSPLLRMLVGEGEKYSCVEDVPLDTVRWRRIWPDEVPTKTWEL